MILKGDPKYEEEIEVCNGTNTINFNCLDKYNGVYIKLSYKNAEKLALKILELCKESNKK